MTYTAEQAGDIPGEGNRRGAQRSTEHRFYLGFTIVLLFAVLLGFSRTFFLRPLFPEWAIAHGAPEPFFYFHGVVFFAWFLLLIGQSSLVTSGRVELHRRWGKVGGVLACAMVVIGTVGALIAARRPTGFMDVPVSPLQFLLIPLADIALFGTFVTFALVKRRKVQSHKRFMLLGSIVLLDAAIGRWPFEFMSSMPIPGFFMSDLFVDLFLVLMVVWDIASQRRIHAVTLWGGLSLIIAQPLRLLLSDTAAWQSFAAWAVSLLGN